MKNSNHFNTRYFSCSEDKDNHEMSGFSFGAWIHSPDCIAGKLASFSGNKWSPCLRMTSIFSGPLDVYRITGELAWADRLSLRTIFLYMTSQRGDLQWAHACSVCFLWFIWEIKGSPLVMYTCYFPSLYCGYWGRVTLFSVWLDENVVCNQSLFHSLSPYVSFE